MDYLFIYFIAFIIEGIFWGVVTNKIIENKGYQNNWFWWGFFFGFIAFIVALTKSDNVNVGSYIDKYGNVYGSPSSAETEERRQKYILADGGWKCPKCNTVNSGYTTSCKCGMKKGQSYVPKQVHTQEQVNSIKDDSKKNGQELDNLEILKKYKELLDMGAITEEEFNEKKQEIMHEKQDNTSFATPTYDVEERASEWTCTNCETKNDNERKSCRYCGAIKQIQI